MKHSIFNFRHLNNRGILDKLPFDHWYSSMFASILNKLALIRIFDKIASGSIGVLVFVFIVICSHLRFQLKNLKLELDDAVKIIEMYGGDDDSQKSEVVINKAIDLWQKYCMKK